MSNWKIADKRGTWIKVISFPVPEEFGFTGESMWVKKVSGTDNDGTGILNNDPAFCTEVGHGDLVKYAGGTDEEKPHYAGLVEGD